VEQVVAPEDHRPADVAAELVALVDLGEVALTKIGRDVVELLRREERFARLGECFVVHVGRIDLDALPESVAAEGLEEQHCHGVRLLSGRAAGGPHADRLLVALGLEDGGEHFRRKQIPRLLVPKEPGDVDQDRVEELGVLLRMGLEVVLVVLVRRGPDRLHPLLEAAHE
jgi:hypothetical protein